MIKKYRAYVALNVVRYFNEKLETFGDKIHRVEVSDIQYSVIEKTPYQEYIIEAEEGIIDPKHELKGS